MTRHDMTRHTWHEMTWDDIHRHAHETSDWQRWLVSHDIDECRDFYWPRSSVDPRSTVLRSEVVSGGGGSAIGREQVGGVMEWRARRRLDKDKYPPAMRQAGETPLDEGLEYTCTGMHANMTCPSIMDACIPHSIRTVSLLAPFPGFQALFISCHGMQLVSIRGILKYNIAIPVSQNPESRVAMLPGTRDNVYCMPAWWYCNILQAYKLASVSKPNQKHLLFSHFLPTYFVYLFGLMFSKEMYTKSNLLVLSTKEQLKLYLVKIRTFDMPLFEWTLLEHCCTWYPIALISNVLTTMTRRFSHPPVFCSKIVWRPLRPFPAACFFEVAARS